MRFTDMSNMGTATGAASGAALAAIMSYLKYRKDKNQPAWKKILKGLGWTALGGVAGGAVGAYAGRMLARHSSYKRLKDDISRSNSVDKPGKRTGRLIYIDCDKNMHEVTDSDNLPTRLVGRMMPGGGISVGHSMLATIDDKTGDMKIFSIGVASKRNASKKAWDMIRKGAETNDNALIAEGMAVAKASSGGVPRLDIDSETFKNVGGKSDQELADLIGEYSKKKGYGRSVVLHEGAKGIDLRLPEEFMRRSYEDTFRSGGGLYSPMPGGFNCGTAAREAFDASQTSQLSHFKDMLWGGGSSANAPSGFKSWRNSEGG